MGRKFYGAVILMLTAVAPLFADNHILESDFVETKTIAANGKQIKSSGKLYFEEDRFAMHYEDPEGDLLIINGNSFLMDRGHKRKVFNMEVNKPMRSLGNILLASMRGEIGKVAEMNNADFKSGDTGEIHWAVMTARKKSPRGYSKIECKYDRKTGWLVEMTMTEFNGNFTTYQMTGYCKNYDSGDKIFTIEDNRP